jgi:hypothetical protein
MNADGSDPSLVSGDWDRSPQDIKWAADGSGLYFTAQNEGSQNLHFLPLSGGAVGKVQPVTKGVHILSVGDIGKSGLAVGTLTSPQKPGDIVSFNLKAAAEHQAVDERQR